MVATSGDITRCRFPGFQVSYEPKATWKPRKHRKPGNLGNQETWKPGKRFPSSQVSRVPGFLGSQVSRFPRFPGFLGFLGKLGNLGTWEPGNLKNLDTWKPFSRFPGPQVDMSVSVTDMSVTLTDMSVTLRSRSPLRACSCQSRRDANLETFFQVSRTPG